MIPDDIEVEAWPPRGQGGQHVGTHNAVKVTHTPSGLEVVVDVCRSQHRNKAIALEMIMAAITHPEFGK
jgi:protein subunit release factor A